MTRLTPPQRRSYKDPDLAKVKFTMNITDDQRAIFKRAVALSGKCQGDFLAMVSAEYVRMAELRKAELGE